VWAETRVLRGGWTSTWLSSARAAQCSACACMLTVSFPFAASHSFRLSSYHAPAPSLRASPQNLIFRFLQTRQRVEVWLYAATDMRMRGFIVGFDEYMNVVLDDAVEVSLKRKTYVWLSTCCPHHPCWVSQEGGM